MASDVDFYAHVGRQIRAKRINRRMTQEDLAHAAALTRTSITNIERGRQKLLVHTLAKIAEALRVGVAELVPASDSDSDVLLMRMLENHSDKERDWIKLVLRSVAKKGEVK